MEESAPAPAPASTEPRQLGQLLSDSLSLTLDGLWQFATILAIGLAPGSILVLAAMALFGYSSRDSLKAAVESGQFGGTLAVVAAGLIGSLFRAVATVAVILTVDARDRGQELPVGEAYSRAAGRLVPFLWTEFQAGLRIFFGILLLVIPGILCMIRYSLAHVVVVLEDSSGSAALARSRQIVMAHTGKVIGNMFVVSLIVVFAFVILAIPLKLASAFVPGGDTLVGLQLFKFIQDFADALVGVWSVALTVILFKDLAALHTEPAP